ncbi:hypothetical protein GGI25_002067 [Coemansia spiralis]|uniref:Altered inheritance of mitochondria protein 24, mitochondrial n=2 Tax=Coemansia TaxID=4863 RepID=A0A9W8G4L7_9FUNG|nr:hypothetical protein EDC05_002681 [Coemansia umbellata]KAJ2623323.1 hypothetical protein GGI26_002551 [Coemansia sp. RSA 1358]KAJ2678874.1 hypothetical protein GGI25_002067 [Coemansia spiralis]
MDKLIFGAMNRQLAPTRLAAYIQKRQTSVLFSRKQADQKRSSQTDRKLSRGLSGIFQSSTPVPVDPRFEVVDSGYGSLIMAKLPPYSMFYTQVGQTLGQSPKARSRVTTKGALAVAALRPLLGRSAFVQEISTEGSAADVLIAPKRPGDVVVVGMNGSVEYFVRKGSLLAQTRFLAVSTWNGIGAEFNALAFDKVSGRGTFVINSFGGIHRLVLQEGEEYYVDPRYVIAWSSTLDVAPQSGRPRPLQPGSKTAANSAQRKLPEPNGKPSELHGSPLVSNNLSVQNNIFSPAKSPAEPLQKVRLSTESKQTPSTAKNVTTKILNSTIWPLWHALKSGSKNVAYASANAIRVGGWAATKTTRTLAGVPDLYRVTGPGDIYVATRLTPKPWTRITHAISAKSQAQQ